MTHPPTLKVIKAPGTPATRPEGATAPRGALYVDETNATLYQNTGTFWEPTWTRVYADGTGTDGALVAANNLSDLVSASTARTNIGLGSVQNYGIATQEEAEAGAASNKYMTPARTAEAIAALGGGGSITTTSTMLDLSTARTIIDDDVANTLITDTSKPGSPQYTYTVTSGNLPSSAYVQDYMAFLTIGGFNNEAVTTRAINCRPTLNGVEVDADRSANVTAQRYWAVMFQFSAAALAANDVLGIKMWAAVSGQIDYRYATIYIVPRYLAAISNEIWSAYGTGNSISTAAGAVSGVNYGSLSPVSTSPNYTDPTTTDNVSIGAPTILTEPLQIALGSVPYADQIAGSANGAGTVSRLYGLQHMRYIRRTSFAPA